MTKNQSKFAVACLIIVGAIFYLIFTGVSQTSVYYLTVSELMDRKETISFDEGVRVTGLLFRDRLKGMTPISKLILK